MTRMSKHYYNVRLLPIILLLYSTVETALLNKIGFRTEIVAGQSISFTCTADGINRPNITWRIDGQLIIDTTRLNIETFGNVQGFRPISGIQQITSLLTISDLRGSDSGMYSCRAENEVEIPVSLDSPFVLIVLGNCNCIIKL